jgi:undecaprenyl-diphosphatase
VTLAQALFMGLLQGATELFPVSSLGHSVIIPSLVHWQFKQSNPTFVPFLVLLHLGTAGALLVLYRREWIAIIRGFFTAAVRGRITTEPERLAMLLLTGTIPAGILGVFFDQIPFRQPIRGSRFPGRQRFPPARVRAAQAPRGTPRLA